MPSNAKRTELTRGKLIAAAKKEFVKQGFAEAHTHQIITKAGVSRGAMYHHFDSKESLFEAVFESVSEQSIKAATINKQEIDSPFETLIHSCIKWLERVQEPETATILLDMGPQVLGWKRARDIEAKSSLGRMRKGIQYAVDAGEIEVVSVEVAARLLNALIAEMALIQLYKEYELPVAEQELFLRQFLKGLKDSA